jgi:hypothetical protein
MGGLVSGPDVPRIRWPFNVAPAPAAQDLQHQAREIDAAPDVAIPAWFAKGCADCVHGFMSYVPGTAAKIRLCAMDGRAKREDDVCRKWAPL